MSPDSGHTHARAGGDGSSVTVDDGHAGDIILLPRSSSIDDMYTRTCAWYLPCSIDWQRPKKKHTCVCVCVYRVPLMRVQVLLMTMISQAVSQSTVFTHDVIYTYMHTAQRSHGAGAEWKLGAVCI